MKKGIEINIKNLSLDMGGNKILNNVTINFEPGKIHAITGPNGGGKTSFLKCLLEKMPYSGEIEMIYEGEKKIGYVPQVLDFEKSLPITIEDFLSICYQRKPAFFGPNKKNKLFFQEILKEVGLDNKKNRLLGKLSGGEMKRLLLSQAINPKPNLLILDEPFSGVDTVGESYFIEIIKKLRDSGITIIWVHHNIKTAREIADTVTFIKNEIKFHLGKHDHISKDKLLEIYT